ncbi:hypothetical protein F4692_003874 [Nocardioides cavernae]|uniref:DUF3558 domain-containing protein n=1 Tax=Nocardioides cavernae TaxID=1921566 RepID=A0A7Y9H6D8_9ACTN|nr:hypothetical protein [Nocardioides cavernae]NYE38723.1 hypothetical protein [Nocardioides cavernae]
MRLTPLVGLLAACLVATGCSSGEEPAPGAGAGTASTSTTTEPAPDEDATDGDPTDGDGADGDGAAAAGVGVCDLLAPSDYRRFIRKDLRRSVTEDRRLGGWSGSMFTCTVESGPFSLFSFSYSTAQGAWPAIKRFTRPQKIPQGGDKVLERVARLSAQKRVDVPNLADEAFFSQNLGGTSLYALEDGVAYEMGITALTNGPEEVTSSDYLAVMITLIANASAGVASEAVQLPAQCPPATSTAVTDVIGEVAYAFGSAYRGQAPSCSYAAVDGRTLRAAATVFATRRLYDLDALPPAQDETRTVVDSPRGTSAGVRREGANWSWYQVMPARLETVSVATDRVTWGPRPRGAVDREAFLAFVDAYRALASDQLGTPY